jgi:methyltransferase (TIGR00027 family)
MARTDNDTWDLASSVGATATMVAVSRAVASQGPDPLIDDPFADPLVRAVGHDVFTGLMTGELSMSTEDTDPAVGRRQMAEQMAVRTRFFDQFFTAAGEAGIAQAVILASGLDARAFRLPWAAGTVVYEIDQPEVIEFKTSTLAGLGALPTAERRTVAIDLRDDWPAALRRNGFDAEQPTAWIAEGLLMYLPPDAQDRLFDHITDLSAAGSRVACELIPDMNVFNHDRTREMADRWRAHGYDLDLSDLVYHGERNHVIDYVTARGWQPTTKTTLELYADNGFTFPDDELAAAFGDVSYVSAILK